MLGDQQKKRFSAKLMDVLNDKSNEEIIHWFAEGEKFIIVNKDAFTKEVLPQHFKVCKFESFVRKLYRWGFKRVYKTEKDAAFYHPMFTKGSPEMCKRMKSFNILKDKDASEALAKPPKLNMKLVFRPPKYSKAISSHLDMKRFVSLQGSCQHSNFYYVKLKRAFLVS